MLFSETKNHPVLATDTATTAGILDTFIIDPGQATVVALRLNKSGGTGDTLHWKDVTAFGVDTITVTSAQAITAAQGRTAELSAKHATIVGKRLLTDDGTDIGPVTDVDFDPATGAVIALVTTRGPVEGRRLIGSGSYAVSSHTTDTFVAAQRTGAFGGAARGVQTGQGRSVRLRRRNQLGGPGVPYKVPGPPGTFQPPPRVRSEPSVPNLSRSVCTVLWASAAPPRTSSRPVLALDWSGPGARAGPTAAIY